MVQKRKVADHDRWIKASRHLHRQNPGHERGCQKDDYLVKGDCKVDMQTIKDLDGLDKTRVTSANYNTFGGNPHIKVVGI